MNVLLLSSHPLGATDIDRVLLSGLQPSAVDVCPSVDLALTHLARVPPDLIVVNLPEPAAADAVSRLREHGVQTPTVVVTPLDAAILGAGPGPLHAAQVGGRSARPSTAAAEQSRRDTPRADEELDALS